MKQIVLVRHAKAVPYGYINDFDRDLRERGKNDAILVSRELNLRGISPDLMISSPANRSLTTANIFAENLGYDKNNIEVEIDLYHGFTTSEFLRLIHTLPPEINTTFFFGHNPNFQYFAQNLLKNYNQDMPTCTTLGINFNINKWKDIKIRTGEIAFKLTPRMLK